MEAYVLTVKTPRIQLTSERVQCRESEGLKECHGAGGWGVKVELARGKAGKCKLCIVRGAQLAQ